MIRINNTVFGRDTFPNGEVVYKTVNLNKNENTIRMNFENNKDIADLMFAVEYIRDVYPDSKVKLDINYTPYSRMDREINNQIFSLRLFARIIANMQLDEVYILDPHSEVCEKEFKDAGVNVLIREYKLWELIADAIDDFNPDIIFLPDKGAYNKYTEVLKNVSVACNIPVMYGQKIRDLSNKGKIMGYAVINDNNINMQDTKVLIVDDICSFGGTALNAAKKLKEMGVSKVGFYIAHAEYCIGGGEILKTNFVDKVYTSTSLLKHDYSHGIMVEDMDNEWALNIGVAVNHGKMKIKDI